MSGINQGGGGGGGGEGSAGASLPLGGILEFGGAVIPDGFLLCDGSEISRITFAGLFAKISTFHGEGNGSTTFNLPDMRGKFVRGVDNGETNDPDAGSRSAVNNGNSGDNVGSVQDNAFQSHRHRIGLNNNADGIRTALIASGGGTGTVYDATAHGGINTGPVFGSTISDFNSGAGGAKISTETRPKNIYVNFIIKAFDGTIPEGINTQLHFARISKTDGAQIQVNITPIVMTYNENTYSFGATPDAANNKIIINQDGRYNIRFPQSGGDQAADTTYVLKKNSTIIETFKTKTLAVPNGVIDPAFDYSEDLVSGDEITLELSNIVGADDIFFGSGGTSAYLEVEQRPATKTVVIPANTVATQSLHHARISHTNQGVVIVTTSGVSIPFDENDPDSSGAIPDQANNKIIIKQAGRYRVELFADLGTMADNLDLIIKKNGSNLKSFAANGGGSQDNNSTISFKDIFVVDDEIEFFLKSQTDNADSIALGVSLSTVVGAYLDVEQLPTTVVVPLAINQAFAKGGSAEAVSDGVKINIDTLLDADGITLVSDSLVLPIGGKYVVEGGFNRSAISTSTSSSKLEVLIYNDTADAPAASGINGRSLTNGSGANPTLEGNSAQARAVIDTTGGPVSVSLRPDTPSNIATVNTPWISAVQL